jgi:4-amino-4-deoxy-L-arabinose transferase-like glycosyltransferase
MRNSRTLLQSTGLRLAGLGLLAVSAFAVIHLYHLEHAGPAHEGTPAEFLVAAVAFFAASGGLALFALGIHIFDKVEISARWAPIRRSGH